MGIAAAVGISALLTASELAHRVQLCLLAAKDLEKENARLKRLLAEEELAIDILDEMTKGKF